MKGRRWYENKYDENSPNKARRWNWPSEPQRRAFGVIRVKYFNSVIGDL
jgi:hypothetical protein